MEATTENKGLIARPGGFGRKALDAQYKDGIRTFVYPPYGPNFPVEVAQAVYGVGLDFPLMDENTSLVHSAWQNPEQEYSEKVIETLRNYFVLASNGLLYLPKKKENEEFFDGVLINDDFDVRNLKELRQNKDELMSYKEGLVVRLKANDSRVRFVPFGYPIGEVSDLSKNALVVGLAGEEGADNLNEVAGKYREKYHLNPYINSFSEVNADDLRIPALVSDRLFGGGGLRVFGSVDDWCGCAFGVQR